MCEPFILQKTGLSLQTHQWATVWSYLDLHAIDPSLPVIPVLQGWVEADYLRHIDAYAVEGIDLRLSPVVGLGSVCRRQGTLQIAALIRRLYFEGLRLHGFGVKQQGLANTAFRLRSADSMAWAYRPKAKPTLEYALAWRERVLETIRRNMNPL